MTDGARRRGRRGLLFALVAIVACALAGVAYAYWANNDSSNPAVAVADSIQAGNTPTLGGVSGSNVTLNWSATTTAAGASVSGYTVSRYSVPSGGTPTAATGGCSGTVAALTCTEQSVPDGLWYYTVTPKIALWTGAESSRLSVRVDTVAPVTTDNTASIGSAWTNQTKTVTLTPTDTGGSGVAATYYTTNGTTPTTSSSQGTSIVLSTDGVYTIKYFSVDNSGNTEAVKTASTQIRIDKTSPTPGSFSLPAAIRNGQVLTNAATDPTVNGASSGVASVAYYYCPGGSGSCTPSTLIGSSSTGPNYSLTWNSQPADGTYQVRAVVTDNAANVASSTTFSTVVDNTAPTGGSVSYTNGYFTSASIPVTFSAGTDGSGSGINTATTQLQKASATLSANSCGGYGTFGPAGSAGQSSPYTDTSVSGGNCYQYQYVVSDNVGNTTTYTTTAVAMVDTTAPVFSLSGTGSNIYTTGMTVYFKVVNGQGTFTVTASDPESGITSSSFPAAPNRWTGPTINGNSATYTNSTANASTSIQVSAVNGAATNSGNQTVNITLDSTAPTFANSQLAIAPIGNTTTVGFVAPGAQYYVYATSPTDAGSGIATVTANVNNITTGQTAVPLVAGSYTVGATTYAYRSAALTANAGLGSGNKNYTGTATDNLGNATTTANKVVVADNVNPTGSITAPSNGWAGASTTVTSSSADATAGVYSAQFQYSPAGAGTWNTIGTVLNPGPYSLTWDTTALTNGGSYDLRVITTDNASNSFTSATVTVTVDRIAPAAPSTPVLSPASDSGVAGDNITKVNPPTFQGTAEAGSTVSLWYGSTLIGTGTATGGNWSITTPSGGDGVYTIFATATDAAGNVSSPSGNYTFTLDTTAPTPVAVTMANGGVAQKVDTGDTVTVQYSEQLNASTLCSTWTNSGTQTLNNVTITVGDNGGTDTLAVSATPTCTFHLSNGNNTLLVGDYVGGGPATFTSSSLTWNPSTNTLVLTFGNLGTFSTIKTGVALKAAAITPDPLIADLAGNTMAATKFTDGATSGF